MKYGHTYEDGKINKRQWQNLAKDSKLSPEKVLPVVIDYLHTLKKTLPKTYKSISKTHSSDFLDILYKQILTRTSECLEKLEISE